MPLVSKKLETSLNSKIKAKESTLYKLLKDKSKGIYKAQEEIDKYLSSLNTPSGFDIESYKKSLWEKTADEWAKSLSQQIISFMTDDVTKILSEEITAYIKQATVITPAGQAVVVATPSGAGSGSTTSSSGPATIS